MAVSRRSGYRGASGGSDPSTCRQQPAQSRFGPHSRPSSLLHSWALQLAGSCLTSGSLPSARSVRQLSTSRRQLSTSHAALGSTAQRSTAHLYRQVVQLLHQQLFILRAPHSLAHSYSCHSDPQTKALQARQAQEYAGEPAGRGGIFWWVMQQPRVQPGAGHSSATPGAPPPQQPPPPSSPAGPHQQRVAVAGDERRAAQEADAFVRLLQLLLVLLYCFVDAGSGSGERVVLQRGQPIGSQQWARDGRCNKV